MPTKAKESKEKGWLLSEFLDFKLLGSGPFRW